MKQIYLTRWQFIVLKNSEELHKSEFVKTLWGCRFCFQGQVEYEASCFEVNFGRKNFASAQIQCSSSGGNLVTINNEWVKKSFYQLNQEKASTFAPYLFFFHMKLIDRQDEFLIYTTRESIPSLKLDLFFFHVKPIFRFLKRIKWIKGLKIILWERTMLVLRVESPTYGSCHSHPY